MSRAVANFGWLPRVLGFILEVDVISKKFATLLGRSSLVIFINLWNEIKKQAAMCNSIVVGFSFRSCVVVYFLTTLFLFLCFVSIVYLITARPSSRLSFRSRFPQLMIRFWMVKKAMCY